MIKDSKLIGTKIAAPFGWKTFKVGELFDVIIPSDSPFDLVDVQDEYHSIPLIKAQTSNHGISGYSSGEGCYIFHSGLTIGMRGSFNVYVHINDVILGNNVAGLALKHSYSECDEYGLVYISSVMSRLYAQSSGYIGYPTMHKLMYDNIIELPVTVDNQPDFEWMSAYIKAVKADYLEQKELSNQNEIKAYLSAGNTDSMDVTDDDRQFLRDFEKLLRRKFKVGELFSPTNPKRYDLKISDVIDNNGGTMVVSSTTVNQGVKGYSSMKPLVKGNKIIYSDAVGPSMMFYQECDFIADAHVKYLKPKFTVNMSKNTALYLITCIQKSTFGVYDYGNKYNNDAVNNTIVELPVIDSLQVDVHSIEKYMRIQSKPLINKVAETLAPVGGGALLVDIPSIERYMQIQIKLTIAKRQQLLDQRLQLAKTV